MLIIIAILAAAILSSVVALLRCHFAITPEERERVKQLRSDKKEIESWVVACKSNLLTTLPSNTWGVNYYNEKIAGLTDKLDAIESELMMIREPRRRAPAPKLNPKWDVSVCKHAVLEPVIPSGEDAIVAWLCTSPACYQQLELNDPAVQAHLATEARAAQKKKLADQWAAIEEWTDEDSERAASVLKGMQTTTQAQAFAAKVQVYEEKQWFSKGGIVANRMIPIRPDLSRFAQEIDESRSVLDALKAKLVKGGEPV